MKGAASNFSADSTVAAAAALERMARAGDLSEMAARWDELQSASVSLTGELKGLVGQV